MLFSISCRELLTYRASSAVLLLHVGTIKVVRHTNAVSAPCTTCSLALLSFVCPSIDPLACSDPAQQRQILSDNKIPVHSIPLITPRARKSSALAAGRSSLIVDSHRPPRPQRSISGRCLCAVLSSPTLSAAFGSATSAALVPTSRRHRISAGSLASGHAANICSRHRRAATHPRTRPQRCRRRLLLACSTYDADAAAAAATACRSQLPSMWFKSKA